MNFFKIQGIIIFILILFGSEKGFSQTIDLKDAQIISLSDGKVIFEWTCGEGERGSQVSEIWLVRKKSEY